jgi:hypothetical protein
VNKLNIRLTRVSQYLSQFELDIRYTPGKDYLIPNAISKLASRVIGKKDIVEKKGNLDFHISYLNGPYAQEASVELHATVYHGIFIKLAVDEKQRIIKGYIDDPI